MEFQQCLPPQLTESDIAIQKTINNFQILSFLGQGNFGKVYKVKNKQTLQIFALKVVNRRKIQQIANQQKKQRNLRYLKEQGINMLRCKNDHIVKCYHIFANKNIKIFLMECCQGGTMQKLLENKLPLNQTQIISIFKQLLVGITEIHRKGLIHRDLKFSNIYFHQGKYKIGDFGIAKLQIDFIHATRIGTPYFMAPQVLNGKQYSQNTDIWSLGIIFYILLFSQFPYQPKESFTEMLNQIQSKQLNFKCKQIQRNIKLIQIVKEMLQKRPEKRPNYIKLLDLVAKCQISGLSFSQIYFSQLNLSDIQKQKSIFGDKQENEQQRQLQQLINESKLRLAKYCQQPIKSKEMYLNARNYHFNGLKAQFILNNIVKTLKQNSLLSNNNRLQIELMYMLCQRCWTYITYCKQQAEKNKQLSNFVSNQYVIKLTKQIKCLFEQAGQNLTIQQQKIKNRMKDGFKKIVNREQYNNKNAIFNGFEKHDYTYEEQISLNCEYIKNWIESQHKKQVKKQINIKNMKNTINTINKKQQLNQIEIQKLTGNQRCIHDEKFKILKGILLNYEKINKIDCETCYGRCSTFIEEVRQILYPLQLI